MPTRRLPDGRIVDVPDGLSKGGEHYYVMQNYGVTPEALGYDPVKAEAGNAVNQFFIGMGKFLADRGIAAEGTDTSIPRPEGFAAAAGEASLPIAAAIGTSMIPGLNTGTAAWAAQGAVAAGLEAAKEGSTAGSTALQGALGTTSAFGGEYLGRVVSGIAKPTISRFTDEAIGLADDTFRTTAQTVRGGGGLNSFIKANLRTLNRKVGDVFGMDKLDDIGDDFFNEARKVVNQTYRAGEPVDDVAIEGVRKALADIPDNASPAVNDLRAALADFGDTIPAARWQAINRSLRDASSELRGNQNWGQWATRIDDGIDALDEAAVAAGGNKQLLGQANQRFKLLATLEESNALVEGGELPAGELLRKLGRDSFKGFGRRTIAEGNERLLPEITNLIDTAKKIAKFERATAGGSATAGRNLMLQPIKSGISQLLSGDVGPGVMLAGPLALAPKVLGAGAVGSSIPGSAGLGAAVGQGIDTYLDDE